MQNINKPFVKQLDEFGNINNFPEKGIVHLYPNKAKRKELLNSPRFKGNKKGISLTVFGAFKYHRKEQIIDIKDNMDNIISKKRILHYLIKN